jgi:hypothetical protein
MSRLLTAMFLCCCLPVSARMRPGGKEGPRGKLNSGFGTHNHRSSRGVRGIQSRRYRCGCGPRSMTISNGSSQRSFLEAELIMAAKGRDATWASRVPPWPKGRASRCSLSQTAIALLCLFMRMSGLRAAPSGTTSIFPTSTPFVRAGSCRCWRFPIVRKLCVGLERRVYLRQQAANGRKRLPLEPSVASPKEQEENHDQQDKTKASTAVIADTRAHVVSTAPENE